MKMEKLDNHQKAHYEALLLRNYLNELTDEEQAELYNALNTYAEVRRMDRFMEEYVKTNQLPSKLPISSILAEYEKFEVITSSKTKRINRNRWMVAACIGAALGLSLYFIWRPAWSSNSLAENMSGTQLTLANGNKILLESDTTFNVTGSQVAVNSVHLQVNNENNAADTSMNELAVPTKTDFHVTLQDGTNVHLNSKTRLKFPFSFGNTREVFIDGEAFFEVKADPQRPFFVNFPGGRVQVLGTSFNINTYNSNQSYTSLVSGSAAVFADEEQMLLVPGTQAAISDHKIEKQSFDTSNVLSWRQGIIYFDAIPLSTITEVIKRWYDVDIILESKTGDVRLTTSLNKNKPLVDFLQMLENTNLLKYNINRKTIHITPVSGK